MPSQRISDLASAAQAALRAPNDRDAQEAVTESWRSLREEKLAAYIRRAVDAAPPLTDEQRRRIASILLGSES